MLCKIKNCHKIGFGIFLSVFAVALSVLFSSDTNAIADLTYTFDFNNIPPYYDICSTTSSCSSYTYMKVEPANPSSCASNNVYFVIYGLVNYNFPVSPCISSLYFLTSPTNLYLTGGKQGSYSGDVTITLSDSFGSVPSGNLDISQNGQYDVSSYATVNVNVPAEVIPGDYHDDLVKINNSILVCGAICLVLYFFYCIYRLIIRNSGSS